MRERAMVKWQMSSCMRTLSHWEAAALAKQIRPKVAIPCHYDMFPDNSADPSQFAAALAVQAPDVSYRELTHGVRFDYSRR